MFQYNSDTLSIFVGVFVYTSVYEVKEKMKKKTI